MCNDLSKSDLVVASGCALANIPLVVVTKEEYDSLGNDNEITIDDDLIK